MSEKLSTFHSIPSKVHFIHLSLLVNEEIPQAATQEYSWQAEIAVVGKVYKIEKTPKISNGFSSEVQTSK